MKRLLTIAGALLLASHVAGASPNGRLTDGGREQKVVLGTPVLAPMAQIRFCLNHPDDCRNTNGEAQLRDLHLTTERLNELALVNREVNAAIKPAPEVTKATQEWKLAPRSGDCHDYAVTKRHDLLSRGWPSRSLLLAEVIVPSGEHHLVLVVRTKTVDLVLDNLNPDLRPVGATADEYKWLRIESPANPLFWSTAIVSSPRPVRPFKQTRRQAHAITRTGSS